MEFRGDHDHHESLDFQGKTHIGKWRSSILIIGAETAERLVYESVQSNLVSCLTDVMQESTVEAALNVNIWSGIVLLLPWVGAFLADSYLGRYWTILSSSLCYMLGLVLGTLSLVLEFTNCSSSSDSCSKPSILKKVLFFLGIYLVGIGQAGIKPSLQAFGADQFDENDPTEEQQMSSFFNWFYLGNCVGSSLGVTVMVYIEEDVGWDWGFGTATLIMALGILVFLSGSKHYTRKLPGGSPISRIVHVFVASYHKRNICVESCNNGSTKQSTNGSRLRCLDKAAIADQLDGESRTHDSWRICTVQQVQEVKRLLSLAPVWFTCLCYGVIFVQISTFFTKQGCAMNRKLGAFEIPAAALQLFLGVPVIILLPFYDKIFVPFAKNITGNERGITLLQRIGMGIFISVVSIIVSALVEMKRRIEAAPMSIFLLLPQYILCGTANVFAIVGMQEFFYDQMPENMKSLGIATYLSVLGIGGILSGVLISLVQNISCNSFTDCWISDDLNQGHLDYFYWFLAVLSMLSFCAFMLVANCYEYKHVKEESALYMGIPEDPCDIGLSVS